MPPLLCLLCVYRVSDTVLEASYAWYQLMLPVLPAKDQCSTLFRSAVFQAKQAGFVQWLSNFQTV